MASGTTPRLRHVPPAVAEAVHIDADEDPAPSAHALRARILGRIAGPQARLPMLSATAAEALRLASDPGVAVKTIEAVVSRDPQLAGRMLGLANSAALVREPVRSLDRALQRLGTGTVRDMLYQAVMESTVLRGADERHAVRERDHAVAVGKIARMVCATLGVDVEFAFVCGLLHDVGRPVVRTAIADEPLDEIARTTWIERLHGQAGQRLATAWSLPAIIREAIARHHDYRTGTYSQIGHAVAVADRLAAHFGHGCRDRLPPDGLAVVHELGLDPAELLVRGDALFAQAA